MMVSNKLKIQIANDLDFGLISLDIALIWSMISLYLFHRHFEAKFNQNDNGFIIRYSFFQQPLCSKNEQQETIPMSSGLIN